MKPLLLCSLYIARIASGADFHARIEVLVSGDDRFNSIVKTNLVHKLESIDGFITVGKEPDFLLIVNVREVPSKSGSIIVLGATSHGKVPDGAALSLLRGDATPEGIENTQRFLNALITIGPTYLTAGVADDLPSMCTEIITTLGTIIGDSARKFPTGSRDPDRNFTNFLLSIGAKPVEQKR